MTSSPSPASMAPRPPWLMPAGVGVIALMSVAALWAVIVVARNWEKIGV